MLLAEKRAARGSLPVQLKPIEASEAERVDKFLHVHLDARVTRDDWGRAIGAIWGDRFAITIEGEEITGEVFDPLGTLATFVASKIR